MKRKFNPNWIGLGLLIVGFVFSAIQVAKNTAESSKRDTQEGSGDAEKRIVRLLHWQLEPGYREALQRTIDRYNSLPHVREANVEVRQIAISEKVYTQYLNVHLISGTAPDLCVKAGSRLVRANAIGKYFEPFGEWSQEPNPYNARAYLEDEAFLAWRAEQGYDAPSDELIDLMERLPWRDTLIDGMWSGYDYDMKNFYAVPVSTFGTTRIYYNKKLMREVKNFLIKAVENRQNASWVEALFYDENQPDSVGYVADDGSLVEWAKGDTPPQSLGQLLAYCEAVRAYAAFIGDEKLVPIAGSEATAQVFGNTYLGVFTLNYTQLLDRDWNLMANGFETINSWRTGVWNFQTPEIKTYFEVIRRIASYFPSGFLGLDREQANRRFVLGKAAMIASGGFDASGIFYGAANKTNPEDTFEVGIMPFPNPAKGERWYKYYQGPRSESETLRGVPFALYKQSPNKEWALNFLRFLTSLPQNERFNLEAGWLPQVVGAYPNPQMAPFLPVTTGHAPTSGIGILSEETPGQILTTFKGQYFLYLSGSGTYEDFVHAVESAYLHERTGYRRMWANKLRTDIEVQVAKQRSLAALEAEILRKQDDGGIMDTARYRILLLDSVLGNSGQGSLRGWHSYYPDEPFPQF